MRALGASRSGARLAGTRLRTRSQAHPRLVVVRTDEGLRPGRRWEIG
jgi:hypothetical protein